LVFPTPQSELFKKDEIKVPQNIEYPCVLKSQILKGGRGKAGLIRFVKSLEEAQKTAEELFNSKYNVNKFN